MKSIRKYINRTKKIFLFKIVLSAIISLLSLNIMVLLDNKFHFFIVMTLLNYVIIDIVYDYLYINGKNLFFDISGYLYKIQDTVNSNNKLDDDLRKLLNIKILTVRDIFVKNLVTLRFLNHNFYNVDTEYDNVVSYANQTIKEYEKQWQNEDIPQNYIDDFTKIHTKKTKDFLGKINGIIHSEFNIKYRRKMFAYELKSLIKNTLFEVIELNNKNKDIKKINKFNIIKG